MRALLVTAGFLILMAWQYRKNTPLSFLIIGTLFAVGAMISTRWESFSEWPLRVLTIGWLTCMLIAAVNYAMALKVKRNRAKLVAKTDIR